MAKYVIHNSGNVVVFSEWGKHSDHATKFNCKSAGFVRFTPYKGRAVVEAYGRSESLDIDGGGSDDTNAICKTLNSGLDPFCDEKVFYPSRNDVDNDIGG